MVANTAQVTPAANVQLAPGLMLVEQEARALLVRLSRVRPFALQQTMVPAAALPPASLSAIDRYLIDGRHKVHRMVRSFIDWLHNEGQTVSPEDAQRRFSMLRMRFNVALAQLDIFASVLTQRSEQETGIWLAGLDIVASDALSLDENFYSLPGMMCFLDRSHGAAIRRAKTRLPGGGDNPVAIIRMPRERMIGSGIASSLVHEVGHQAVALLDLIESIRPLLRGLQRSSGEERVAWRYWERCISEILADFWSVARLGITSTLGLIGVVSLPRYFVTRLNLDDPHPAPWLRVRLSCAIGRVLFPDPQWDKLEQIWLSYYPATDLDVQTKKFFATMAGTMHALSTLLANHRPRSLRGASLQETLKIEEREPARLRALFKSWSASRSLMYQASPTIVFAVIGQARFEGLISPEVEGRIFADMLRYWALRDTLDTAVYCAKPALIPPTTPPLLFATN